MEGKICDHFDWMPTVTVQSRVYHRICSLLPSEQNNLSKFLQIYYFIGDTDVEIEARCNMEGVGFDCKPIVNRGIVTGYVGW